MDIIILITKKNLLSSLRSVFQSIFHKMLNPCCTCSMPVTEFYVINIVRLSVDTYHLSVETGSFYLTHRFLL